MIERDMAACPRLRLAERHAFGGSRGPHCQRRDRATPAGSRPVRTATLAILLILLTIAGSCDGMAQEPMTASVNVERANLRLSPSPGATVVATLSRGTRLHVLERRTAWTRVRIGAREGWMSSSLLSFRTAPTMTAPSTVNAQPPVIRPDSVAAAAPTLGTTVDAGASARDTNSVTLAAGESTDPRLAGRRRASGAGAGGPPPSRDRSRLGAYLGWTGDPFSSGGFSGPLVGTYLRTPFTGSPFGLRVGLELMLSRYREDTGVTRVDWRERFVEIGADVEYGVPLLDFVEAYGTGGLGFARMSQRISVVYHPSYRVSPSESDAGSSHLTYDVGVGTKLGDRFLMEMRLFHNIGERFQLIGGIRW